MHPRLLAPLIFFGLAVHSSALDEETKKAADELVASIKEDIKSLAENDLDGNRNYSLKQQLHQFQAVLANSPDRQVLQLIDSFAPSLSSEKSQQALTALRRAIREEQQRKSAELVARLEKLLEEARAQVLAATEPEQLDVILDQLSSTERHPFGDEFGSERSDSKIQNVLSRIGTAKQFVTNWQDYLQAKKANSPAQALQSLQNLSQREGSMIPRSQILKRMEAERFDPESIAKTLDGIETLDALKPALQKLSRFQHSSSNYGSNSNAMLRDSIQAVSRLEKAYRELEAGLPVNLELFYLPPDNSDTANLPNLVQLRAEIILKALPRYLDLADSMTAKDGESVDQFLNRALADALQRGDIAASRRITATVQLLSRTSRFNGNDLKALQDFAAGNHQTAAGQFKLAVYSLLNALKAGSELLPPAKVGSQLDAIKMEHPKQYEEGMALFLAMPPVDEDGGRRNPMLREMEARMRLQGSQLPSRGGTSVVLPIPPQEPAPQVPPPNEKPATPPAPGES
jgi:hypothetical protein